MSSISILEFEGSIAKIKDQNFNLILQKVGNRPFVLYSVNGAARSGKSFTLNYFIRHLESRVKEQNLPTSKIPLRYKFSQNSIQGIEIWSDPLIIQDFNGGNSSSSSREIAILLMDTPGLWSQKLSAQQNAFIFAFTAFCSSISIFNVMRNLDELIMEKLELYSRYSTFLLEQDDQRLNQLSRSGPFNFPTKLLFLIRDFPYENDYLLGHHTRESPSAKNIHNKESRNYFKDVFESSSCASAFSRKTILSSYKDVECFLLPAPKCQKNPDEDDNFRREMKNFVELLINSCDLKTMTKRIGGREVTGLEFQAHVSAFAKKVKLENFPTLEIIQDSSGRHIFTDAKKYAMEFFKREIESFQLGFPSGAPLLLLQQAHAQIETNTLDKFDQHIEEQGEKNYYSNWAPEIQSEFRNDLRSEIKEILYFRRKLNKTLIERESLVLKMRENAPLLLQAKRQAVKWVKYEGGQYPEKAVVGGFEILGNGPLDQRICYVARSFYKKELIPGKLVEGAGHCTVATCWKEHQITSYEVLVDPYGILNWIPFDSSLLDRAVPGGYRNGGNEPLFIARVPHAGNLIPGKLHSVDPTCFVAYRGTEFAYKPHECEILVYS